MVVAAEGQADRYVVIDGYKPITGLEQLGRDTVEAVAWPMSEAAAVLLDRPLRLSEHESALEVGWLFSKGLQAQVSFTGGKLLDDASQTVTFLGAAGNRQDYYCRKCEKAISAQDVSRRLVANFNYELPVGRGHSYLSSLPKPVDFIIGGWQMNGILTFQKGLPLAISNGGNNTNTNSNGQRPNNNGHPGAKSGAIADRLNAYFDPAVFSQAPNFTFGNTSRFSPDMTITGVSTASGVLQQRQLQLALRVNY